MARPNLHLELRISTLRRGRRRHLRLRRTRPLRSHQPWPEPPIVDLVRLHLAPEHIPTADSALWKNDERELSRRDRAHYQAFQPLSVVWLVALLLAAWALHPPRFLPLNAILSLLFVLALVASILTITLPAAIILWNEPDMESPTFTEGARP